MNIRIAHSGDARAIAEVRVETWRATYRGIIPDHILENLSLERDEEGWRSFILTEDPLKFILVLVTDDGRIRGFAACGGARGGYSDYQGEIYALYVHPDMQRSGGGRMLLKASATEFLRRNIDSMLIWALTENPYREFYSACGGIPALRQTITIGGKELEETGYGWPDLRNIIGN